MEFQILTKFLTVEQMLGLHDEQLMDIKLNIISGLPANPTIKHVYIYIQYLYHACPKTTRDLSAQRIKQHKNHQMHQISPATKTQRKAVNTPPKKALIILSL